MVFYMSIKMLFDRDFNAEKQNTNKIAKTDLEVMTQCIMRKHHLSAPRFLFWPDTLLTYIFKRIQD